MTTVLGNILVDDPCPRCGCQRIWLMRYNSSSADRFVCVCEECRDAVVVEPKRVLLARAGGRMTSWMFSRTP